MPNLPKRPPARIRAFLLAPLLLLIAAAPARAQTAALWFAPHGKTPPQSAALTVFDAGALRAQRDGSRNFKVDVMYGDDAARTFIVKFQLHMDGEKLELVRAENPARAQLFPSQNPVSLVQTAYADYQSAVGPAPDDGDETTGTLIYPGWGELTPRGIFPSATRTAPVRLLTLNLKWKPGAVGSAKLNFTADTREISGIDAYDALSLTVQGPPAEETD